MSDIIAFDFAYLIGESSSCATSNNLDARVMPKVKLLQNEMNCITHKSFPAEGTSYDRFLLLSPVTRSDAVDVQLISSTFTH